jgi:hypothetical protein
LPRAHPPATFRLQGLVTLLTVSSLQPPAGLVSYRQRSWDSPFEGYTPGKASAVLPHGSARLPLSPCGYPAAEAPGRPNEPRFPGHHLSGDPHDLAGFYAAQADGASHGFCPFRVCRQPPWQGFRPASSLALRSPKRSPAQATGAPEFRSAATWPRPVASRSPPRHRATLLGSAHQQDPDHSSATPPGLCVHLAPRRTSLPAYRRALNGCLALPELPGSASVPNLRDFF